MKLAHFYLNFPGTAREAFRHYEKVFQTKVTMVQTFAEAGFAGPRTDVVHLMGSDVVEGGTVTLPIATPPWGPYFGMCHDRFGIPWMVSLDQAV